MNFQAFDRLPILEWAMWWPETLKRWRKEGLPGNLDSDEAVSRHFGLDLYLQDWVNVRKPTCPRPVRHGAGILESEEDYAAIRPHLYPEDAVDLDLWARRAEAQARGEVVLWFTVDGFFWFARELLGIEPHMYAFYDEPELIHQINDDLASWILQVIDRICTVCVPDFMTFAEDLSYNNGPMLSKDMFNTFMRPYYERVLPHLKAKGIIPIVDSDGDVALPAHWFEATGIKGILPLERQAGVDIAALRQAHPDMAFIGHFDKMTMNRGEAAMRAEFERLLPTAAKGGFLISCDHQTPPGVSYTDYQLYLKLFREYAQYAPDPGGQK